MTPVVSCKVCVPITELKVLHQNLTDIVIEHYIRFNLTELVSFRFERNLNDIPKQRCAILSPIGQNAW